MDLVEICDDSNCANTGAISGDQGNAIALPVVQIEDGRGERGPAGPQGEQGPQGETGPAGAQGPAGESCVESVRIHANTAEWWGTTSNGEHFIVDGFSNPEEGQNANNAQWPGIPGSANEYSQYPPNDPDEFFTGLDVCVPDNVNSVPTPFAITE